MHNRSFLPTFSSASAEPTYLPPDLSLFETIHCKRFNFFVPYDSSARSRKCMRDCIRLFCLVSLKHFFLVVIVEFSGKPTGKWLFYTFFKYIRTSYDIKLQQSFLQIFLEVFVWNLINFFMELLFIPYG